MTHRDRFLAAMNLQKPDDKVAMFELEFQIFSEYVGEDPVVGEAYAQLSSKEKEIARGRNAEIVVEASHKAGHDAIRDFGGFWEISPGVPALLWLPTLEDRLEQLKAIRKEAGNEFSLIGTGGGFVGCIPDGNNLYSFIDRLYEDPESVHEEAEHALAGIIASQQLMCEIGIDVMLNATDIAFKNATFLSHTQLDEFFFPYLARWAEQCKKDGLFSILHSDGNLNAVMDKLLECKISGLQCIDPLAEMDIIECSKKVEGRLALIGNVDCSVLQTGKPWEIDELCRDIIEGCKDYGGFIFGGCNAIFKGIPAENYQRMVDARNTFGSFS
jgi:uroporphyrinogen decarboxylase